MSISIEINPNQINTATTKPLQLHYLPAKINGDGEANVDQYFNNYTKSENGYLTNALRGYPLQGEQIAVPHGYKGVVLQEAHKPLDEKADRKFRLTGSFDEFTYWNYDKIPTKGDPYKQALQILTIAEELSKPVTADEVAKEIIEHEKQSTNRGTDITNS